MASVNIPSTDKAEDCAVNSDKEATKANPAVPQPTAQVMVTPGVLAEVKDMNLRADGGYIKIGESGDMRV